MKLASIFSHNMVLQQGMPIPIWGMAQPGARIIIRFAGAQVKAKADNTGVWRAQLKPLSASNEPRSLEITSSDGTMISLSNILVGEVWICSGQSNMAWVVSQAQNAKNEIAQANFPRIRLCSIARRVAETPHRDLPSADWTVCSPTTVPGFSAVGFFFGRELHRRLDVPIGLISASWGGSVAEAWMSRERLLAESDLHSIVEDFERERPLLQERHDQWQAFMDAHEAKTKDTENIGFVRGWADISEPTTGEWKTIQVPGFWQNSGYNFSGIFWYRKIVNLPDAWAGQDLSLALGAIDKSDVTYFNNEQVGSLTMRERSDAWCILRVYKTPGRLVKAGKNILAVRIHSNKFAGGMTGPANAMQISCPARANDAPIALDGAWQVSVEKSYGLVEVPNEPYGPGNCNMPSALYNGMIAPLIPFAMQGAIWYQGESNVGRARQYQTLFQALINDWRQLWGQKKFAFHFVQLANYKNRATAPEPSQWAEIREAQAMALTLPDTGMAVTIDIGDAIDIHPTNKQDVGLRLALNALHTTYGQKKVTPCGPRFKTVAREGRAMRIAFDYAAGLKCRGNNLLGFAIAGADNKFIWADSRIDGETVIVSSPDIADPIAVQYAWSDNPECNLYNEANLPAMPFRYSCVAMD